MSLANYSLNSKQLESYLDFMLDLESKTPIMIWGPPGTGKSEISKKVTEMKDAHYLDFRTTLIDPVDLLGVPSVENGRTKWNTPNHFPPSDSKDRWIINLEELPMAAPMVQSSLYQLTLDRKLGEYTLPEGASIIACGNRQGDGGVFHKFSPALSSRFHHVELSVDVDSWREWAVKNDIAPQVIFFLTYRPELMHQFNSRSKEHSFPCPRTWEFVSNVTKKNGGIPGDLERSIYVGIVGEAAAIEYVAFLRCWRELPHPRTILNNPEHCEIPSNQSSILALCGTLYRMADDTNFDQIVTFAKRLRPEIGEFLVWGCVQKNQMLQYTKAFIEWASHND